MTKPKLAVMYHLMLDQDVIVETLEDLRVTYDGPVAIAIDNMVFNITKDGVTQRRGVVSDFPWPVPSTSHEAVDPNKVIPISDWLAESEIPVEGIDTNLKA